MCEKKKINYTFKVLMALAMIMVVAGHADCSILDIYGFFPYYSFHMPLFIFVSGYFYKEEETDHIPRYCRHKALHLLVPYFIWNFLYGILAELLHLKGFQFGESFSFSSLFLQPFTDGHQFLYNSPAWFVPTLFLVQVINVLFRRALSRLRLEKEALILAVYLFLGSWAVLWAGPEGLAGWQLMAGRVGFLLFFFELGHFYREKLEKHDTLPSGLYFVLVMGLQLVLLYRYQGALAYSTAWMQFPNGPFLVFLAAFTGIAFWLRVARLLTPVLTKSRFILYLADHTYAVMLHQMAGFKIMLGLFWLVSVVTGFCSDFSLWSFQTDFAYIFLPSGRLQFRLFYVLAGLFVPFLIQHAQDHVVGGIRKIFVKGGGGQNSKAVVK